MDKKPPVNNTFPQTSPSQLELEEWKNPSAPNSAVIPFFRPERSAYELYDYQQVAVEKFKSWFDQGKEQEALIALTVGLGKTITACSCLTHVTEQGKKVLWLTHREELLDQSRKELEGLTGLPCSVEKAGRKAGYRSQVVIASVQSLKGKRLEKFATWFRPHLIVCDEAHHALAQTWMAIKSMFFDSKVLNLTATPYRSDVSTRLSLGEVLIEMNTTAGIKMKKLVPPKPVGKLELDLGKVRKSLGDYEVKSLAKFLTQEQILQASTNLIAQNAAGRRGLVFAANVEHGRNLARQLSVQGLRVGEVYGETPDDVRKHYYRELRQGGLDLIVNNLVLTEGFNLPEIDLVAILRPTRNAALYLQMLGRGLRAAEGKKECLVIDVLDTAKRKTSQQSFALPTEEDVRKFAAIQGRVESFGSTFLSWFYQRTEIKQVIEGQLKQHQCTHFSSGESLFACFFKKPEGGWRIYQQDVIARLNSIFTSPAGEADSTDYSRIFNSIRCGNHDAFIHLLAKAGWLYCPHAQLPEALPALKELEEKLLQPSTPQAKNYDFNTLVSQDADLKNFIMDIFGDETDLGAQAKKYYELHRVEGIPVVWYKAIDVKGANFSFFSPHKGKIWIRTSQGETLCFATGRGFISPLPQEHLSIRTVPIFNQSTQWSSQKMTSKQAAEVAKILDIPLHDLEEANISRLSASALMSAAWNKRYLVKIKYWLERRPAPVGEESQADQPNTVINSEIPAKPTLEADGKPAPLADTSTLRFKKTL